LKRGKGKIGLISSHGGHLTEILSLKDVCEGWDTFFVTYEGVAPSRLDNVYFIKNGWFRNPIHVFLIWIKVFSILIKERPRVLFSTGAEIAIPIFLVGKFLFGCKLIYLECSAQVTTPSLTGRLLYRFTDLFLVQWEPLLKCYGPKAIYRGGLI
jgi:UDP-N-acetylglucosamine:LPS N-acetylglucosamine transferase